MVSGNGGKITTWPIKYPHIKKNAQLQNTHHYPVCRPLNTNTMGDWIINIILGLLVTLCILVLIQIGVNFYTGVY